MKRHAHVVFSAKVEFPLPELHRERDHSWAWPAIAKFHKMTTRCCCCYLKERERAGYIERETRCALAETLPSYRLRYVLQDAETLL